MGRKYYLNGIGTVPDSHSPITGASHLDYVTELRMLLDLHGQLRQAGGVSDQNDAHQAVLFEDVLLILPAAQVCGLHSLVEL